MLRGRSITVLNVINKHISLLPCNYNHQLSSSYPPPEWIEPYHDLSDVATSKHQPSTWVQNIIKLLDGSPTMESSLDAYCHKFLIKLSPRFVSFILKSPELKPNTETALRFFNWACNQSKYCPTLESFTSLIDLFATSNDSGKIKQVFNQLKKEKLEINLLAANSLIKALGNHGMVEELLYTWKSMKENGIEPTLYTYNFLLNGLVNSFFIEAAERVFEVMQTGKVSPDIVSFNTMIKGYCKANQTSKAMKLFKSMEYAKPDKITYMTLIQALYTEGDIDTMVSLYNEMKETQLDIPRHAYTLLISALCKEGRCIEAHSIFESMVCAPNVAIYTTLIDANSKAGNHEEAMLLFEKMKGEGINPDEVTYGVLINSLCKSKKLKDAKILFERCKAKGVKINSVIYANLISGFGEGGEIAEAEKLFEEMEEKGCVPDSYCFNALMDAYASQERVGDALELFERMNEGRCDPTVHTYTILIGALFKKRRNEEALKMWEMMIERGVTPTATAFRVMSNGLCMAGKVARACKILDELAPMGIVIESPFDEMIGVLCRCGRIKEACKLADGVIDRERESQGRVRSVLINSLRKSGNIDLALKLMHSNIGIGFHKKRNLKMRVKFRTLLGR